MDFWAYLRQLHIAARLFRVNDRKQVAFQYEEPVKFAEQFRVYQLPKN